MRSTGLLVSFNSHSRCIVYLQIRCPHPAKKLSVLLLGGSKNASKLLEHYCGAKTKTAEKTDCFAVVQSGASKKVSSGDAGLAALGECIGKSTFEELASIKGSDRAVVHEEVENDKNDFVLVNFIRAPDLVGIKTKNLDWRGSIVLEVAQKLQGRPEAARRLFDKFDTNKDKMLSVEDMRNVLTEVDVGVSIEKVETLCRALDFDDKGAVNWEEFLGAFKETKDTCAIEEVIIPLNLATDYPKQ